MAGIQLCFRSKVFGGLRLVNKDGIFRQVVRERHVMYQMSFLKNTKYVRNSKIFFTSNNYGNLYRLASTNATIKEPVQTVPQDSGSEVAGSPATDLVKTVDDVGTVANSNSVIDVASLPPIPTADIEQPIVMEFVSLGLKEPTFKSLYIGSNWPPGLIQQLLEFLHISCDLPWWSCIALVTCMFRILLFPLTLRARRQAIHFSNHVPRLEELQTKIALARQTGNYYEGAHYIQEFEKFMKENKLSFTSTLWPNVAQAPVFISMYMALKGMVEVPVESLRTGGLFWFEDLTLPDPYYILPIYTAATLYAVLEINLKTSPSAQRSTSQLLIITVGSRVLPLVVLSLTVSFSSSILFYWSVTNSITLLQTLLFKVPFVSNFFKIPKAIHHDLSKLPSRQKGFVQSFKDGYESVKITREIENRERLNAVTFQDAGKGPVQRTFKRNPRAKKS